MFTLPALCVTKHNSVEIVYIDYKNLRYNFNAISPPWKLIEENFFLAPMLRLAIFRLCCIFQVLKLSMKISRWYLPSNHDENQEENQKNIFFWLISGTELEHFWNCFGKNKCPGALPRLKKTSLSRKDCIATNRGREIGIRERRNGKSHIATR